MDGLNSPINFAHSLTRKAASVAENGEIITAIELYKQANENLTLAFEAVSSEPILRKSIELQLVENDWAIHVLTLRSKAGDDESPVSSPERKCAADDKDDDEIVVIDHVVDHTSQSSFLLDSLYPNRTFIMQSNSIRQRSSSASALRNPLRPTSDNNNDSNNNKKFGGKVTNHFSFKKLPKTDADREEEILEEVKLKQKLARELFSA